jgi:hypothetical protein
MTTEKTDSVLSVLDSIRMQATFYEFEGMCKGKKYKLSYGRGDGTTKMPYFRKAYNSKTIVEENQVIEIVVIIRASAIKSQEGVGGTITAF